MMPWGTPKGPIWAPKLTLRQQHAPKKCEKLSVAKKAEEYYKKNAEIELSRTSKSMVSSTQNSCFRKTGVCGKRHEIDLKMTPKLTQNGAERDSREENRASKTTLETNEKKLTEPCRSEPTLGLKPGLAWKRKAPLMIS